MPVVRTMADGDKAHSETAAPGAHWSMGGVERQHTRLRTLSEMLLEVYHSITLSERVALGEDRGRREEAAGEGNKGHGRSGQGGRGVDGGTRQVAGRGGAGSGGAAARVGASSEKAGEGGEGGTGRQAAQVERGGRRVAPHYSDSGSRLSRRSSRLRCRRGHGGRSGVRQ